ncbi:MAG: hypothetical protein KAJ32_07980, partial [Gammaproteobacteria bacterium]|nr:hypothetical protein [Gammaproteobacteria bacterium]
MNNNYIRISLQRNALLLSLLTFTVFSNLGFAADSAYPPSNIITNITFDMTTLKNITPGNKASAPESDNWA